MKIKKTKVFYWKDLGSAPSLVIDDKFTSEDRESACISIILDEKHNGASAKMMVRNLNGGVACYYLGVVGNGVVEFPLDKVSLCESKFLIMLKIQSEDVVATSALVRYDVELIGKVQTVFLPESETKSVDELIDELQLEIQNAKDIAVSLESTSLLAKEIDDTVNKSVELASASNSEINESIDSAIEFNDEIKKNYSRCSIYKFRINRNCK